MPDKNEADSARLARVLGTDPDTTLDDPPFVQPTVSTVDVFAVVAVYDHEVGRQTATEYATYDDARSAGILLLSVNPNVISFRIDKRTTRKA